MKVKAQVRERDGHRCTRCGMTAEEHREQFGKTLDVHRVTPGSWYSVEACTTLCRPCHGPEPRRPRGQRHIDEPWTRGELTITVSKPVAEALATFIGRQKIRPTKTSVVVQAIKEFLIAEGVYPSKNHPLAPPPEARP